MNDQLLAFLAVAGIGIGLFIIGLAALYIVLKVIKSALS